MPQMAKENSVDHRTEEQGGEKNLEYHRIQNQYQQIRSKFVATNSFDGKRFTSETKFVGRDETTSIEALHVRGASLFPSIN